MKRFGFKIAATAAIAVLVASVVGISADDKKTLTVKECMKCQNDSRTQIEKLLKAKEVNWEKVESSTKTWTDACMDLSASKVKKGSADSWKEQTEKYAATVKAIGDAAEKKDAKEVSAKLKEFGASCGGCHSKHKGK